MLTGRDLIIYILENHLEDEPIFDDGGVFLGFMTEMEAAVKLNVGVATIKVWYERGLIKGVKLGNALFIPVNTKRPDIK